MNKTWKYDKTKEIKKEKEGIKNGNESCKERNMKGVQSERKKKVQSERKKKEKESKVGKQKGKQKKETWQNPNKKTK